MDIYFMFGIIGFLIASYTIIANDSMQTLGTFISSNKKIKWQYLWLGASSVLAGTIIYSFVNYGGDISYGRLEKIPYIVIQWYHLLPPIILLILTRFGIPVSTSLMVFSVFASGLVFEKVLIKSFLGYSLALVIGLILFFIISKFFKNTEKEKLSEKYENKWRTFQWITTGFLWFTWLSHDVANIAVFLPRELNIYYLILILIVLISSLGYVFYKKGGKIQEIVKEKTNLSYIKTATFIDLIYAFILLFFKGYSSIPMSTTWVFLGLIAGREIALYFTAKDYHFKSLFPILGKDLVKVVIGLVFSILIVLFVTFLAK